jgi:hypothetical protein
MGEKYEWRTQHWSSVILVNQRITLEKPVFVSIILDQRKRVTEEKTKKEKGV